MHHHLILLRHGKAKAHDPGGDHQRPLKPRGVSQARDVGRWLVGQELVLERMLVSTAVRACETADGLQEAMADPSLHRVEESALYLAEPARILEYIRATPPGCGGLVVVGHNPGLSQLAAELTDEPGLPELPTGGLVALRCDDQWAELSRARLIVWRKPLEDHA